MTQPAPPPATPRPWRRPLLWLPLAAAVALGLALYAGLGRDPGALPSALIGMPAPAFSAPPLLPDRPGLSSEDLKGQPQAGPQVVNVFASWCVPCRAEHPLLMALAADGHTINGLNWKDRPDAARAWLEELGNPYARIGSDPEGRAGLELGVYGVPETFVVDADGTVLFRHVGPLRARHLRQDILPLLAPER